MKRAVVALVMCVSSSAHAGPPTFDSFKLVNEKPTLHKPAELNKALKSMRAAVSACGTPRIDARFGALTADAKLHVATDGSVESVSLDSKTLGEDTIDCIATAMKTIKIAAKKKASVVSLVLVYKRKL
jgi:hypothetical protein